MRTSTIERKTAETDIYLSLNLYGSGKSDQARASLALDVFGDLILIFVCLGVFPS